ncbi:hypothetical protein MCOR21_007289 [Pyricularia oryzae]|nr:hypothetical protein MCOR21_007289 [Pyricularia oryzae]
MGNDPASGCVGKVYVVDITHWQTWLTVGEVETTGKAGPVGQVHPVTPGVLLMNFGIVQSKEYLSNFSRKAGISSSGASSLIVDCLCLDELRLPPLARISELTMWRLSRRWA